ncbi:MAG: formyltetrahydrofolate deformylase [Coxiellaceae bacterium]|nr:formyltetrahydrofolate deformylase [Coxiellaceae bacterium]
MLLIYNIVLACPDKKGIVAAVSQCIAGHGGFIVEADQHSDFASGWFFMRYRLDLSDITCTTDEFFGQFDQLAQQYEMSVSSRAVQSKPRMVIMVSKQSHCLEDLLYRWHCNELPAEIVGVISNHPDLRQRTEWYGLPYYECPIEKGNKQQHFDAVDKLFEQLKPEVIVLARYMQIMPPQLCEKYVGRMINIHHSFLPSFVGAKPYSQAYEKGVKLIGATSHYVTADLDQGPIIEQAVTRVTHRQSLDDFVRMGRDVERLVLAKALMAHLEQRVIVHGQKTVVFGT